MNNKHAILQHALSLFYHSGYENSGVQKIADAAQIGKPTIYHYFGSKKGLLEAILVEHFTPFWPQLERACNYKHDLVNNLEAIAACYFSFSERHPVFYRWYLSIMHAPPASHPGELISAIIARQWKLLEILFSQAQNDHGNMRDKEKQYAISFLGIINSYISAQLFQALSLQTNSAHTVCKQFMHGIFS